MNLFALSHWTSFDLGYPAQYGYKSNPDQLNLMVAVATVPKPKWRKGVLVTPMRTVQDDIATWETVITNAQALLTYAQAQLEATKAEDVPA